MSEQFRGSYPGFLRSELRIVLLGNLGCGKTSSADTILGQQSAISPTASKSCQLRRGSFEGRSVTLVEAPRWYWRGGKMEDCVRKDTERAMTLAAPGAHGILLLVPVSQFTEMECHVPAELEEVFGGDILDHTMVLLTCGDYLMRRSVEEYLQKEHPGLRQIIERCGGRYHVINNRRRQDKEQVRELLEKVDSMVRKNGIYHMKTAQDRELERRVTERKRELMESYRAEREARRETAASTCITNTETLRSTDGGEEYSTTLETRRGQEEKRTEGREGASQVSNGLHSTPATERQSYSEPHDDGQVKRTPSFRLNADGAILSQISEVKSAPKVITTLHHRFISFEEKSPELLPTSSPHSPVFSSSSSSPSLKTIPASPTSSPPSSASTPSLKTIPASPLSSSSSLSLQTIPASSSSSPSSSSSSPSLQTVPASPSSSPSSSSPSLKTIPASSSSFPSSSSPSSQTIPASSSSSPSLQTIPTSPSSSPSSFSSPSLKTIPTSPSSSPPSSSPSLRTIPASSSSSPPSSSCSPSLQSVPTSPSSSSSSSSSPELRLVLLGRSGSGKSAAGNSILGREEFNSYLDSLVAITQECEKKKALVEGRRVAVVDTPDWFNSESSPDEVRAQISSCVALSSPGPHAFLLCVPLDQPAKTELQALRALEVVFGPRAVQNHTLILFTHADQLKVSRKAGNNSVEAYIASQRGDLLKLVEKCRDRYHVMESGGGGRDRSNVVELLEKVEQTVKEAGGQYYSCPAFQEAESRVRQRQVEIAREKRDKNLEQEKVGDAGQLSSDKRVLHPYMQPVAEAEEEVREEEIEKTRDEAEMSVRTMNIESLPPITLSSLSPSLLSSFMDKVQSRVKILPKLLADSSVWVGDGAQKVKSSPVWGTVGSRAQNIQKMVGDSSVWGKVGAGAGHVSKLVGDRVPKVVVDGSAWVGSGAKAAAASPMWGKVGSGAKLVADGSMRVGAGIGTGAKNLAQSPVWGKVGSGAKTGAKLVADGSVRVGARIGAGAKKVARSPVWEKVGSGAKSGVKMVAESSVWEKIGTTAKKVPKITMAGALLGLVLGVFLGGVIGGAVGAAAGSAVTEVGRRKLCNKNTLEKTNEVTKNMERAANDSVDPLVKQGRKVLKAE